MFIDALLAKVQPQYTFESIESFAGRRFYWCRSLLIAVVHGAGVPDMDYLYGIRQKSRHETIRALLLLTGEKYILHIARVVCCPRSKRVRFIRTCSVAMYLTGG
eukprot:IDg14789t1